MYGPSNVAQNWNDMLLFSYSDDVLIYSHFSLVVLIMAYMLIWVHVLCVIECYVGGLKFIVSYELI